MTPRVGAQPSTRSSTEDCVFYEPPKGVYHGRNEIDRVAGAIKGYSSRLSVSTHRRA